MSKSNKMMIGKKEDTHNNNNGLHNALASGTTVKGNIQAEMDFRLDGHVEGDIACNGKIVIGPQGKVVGNIQAANAEIHGEVNGTLKISEKLILKSTGSIIGDVTTRTLEIEPNGSFNGQCSMQKSTDSPR